MKTNQKIFLILILLLAFNIYARTSLKNGDFYISPCGDDSNPGTIDKPFATLQRARDAARSIDKDAKDAIEKDIIILLRGGTYQLEETFVLEPRDSNTTYAAYSGETPVISGGKKIEGWEKSDGAMWAAKTPLEFRQLYVNGKRATRARMPNGPNKYYRLKSWDKSAKKIIIDSSEITNWENFKSIEMIVQLLWAESILRLNSYSSEGNNALVTVQNPERDIVFARPYPIKYDKQAYHFENAYEFLDAPGEWYLNTETDTLYYKPQKKEDVTDTIVVAPILETLIKIQGTLDSPAHHIKFQGLTFTHSNWTRPSCLGFLNMQAGMYNLSADEKNNQYCGRPPAAVYVAAANNIKFEDNTFRFLGATGLDLHYGTHDNEIVGNVFHDISGGGILVGRFSDDNIESHVVYNPKDKRDICTNEKIHNNYITNIALDYYGCVAIGCGWPRNISIEHNEIANIPYSAISVGWGWTNEMNVMRYNRIRYNRIYNVMTLLADGGAIYTISPQPNSEISYNYIYNIQESKWSVWPEKVHSIYLDEGSDGFMAHHNVTEKVVDEFHINRRRIGENLYITMNYADPQQNEVKSKAGLEPRYQYIKKKVFF